MRFAELLPLGGERSEDSAMWVTYGSASATRDWMADLYDQVLRYFQGAVTKALDGTDQAALKGRLITALVNGLTLDNLRAP
ncbi:TetR family transcriptional regulator C-terminal domain-containing protein [Corynebacterium sp. ACRQK]|uniref:TetR family transcriptional regulator C-terminal domain-containing protein n=1 Tax=Corynebacterium sp. ACRQK TaxID=2918190 RepID=UPI00351CD006